MPTRKVISAEALVNFDDGPTIEYGTKISEDMLDASLIGLELTFEDGAKKSITDLSGIDIANVQADNFTYRVGSEIVAGGEITKQAKNWLGEKLDASKRSQILFMDREDILNLYIVSNLPLPDGAISKPTSIFEDDIPF